MSSRIADAIKQEVGKSGLYSQGTDAILAVNDTIKELPESKKNAKKQFRADLYSDPEYIEYKKNKNNFGVANVNTQDPFYKQDNDIEFEIFEKWSEKYKKSIDCNNPKGFSQRAHCQGRKKIDESLERTYISKLKQLSREYADKDNTKLNLKDKVEKHFKLLKKQLTKGINVEKEHKSGNPILIALDHLKEDPEYYDKLEKIESMESTGTGGSSGSFEAPLAFKDSNFVRKSFKETPKKIEATEATDSSSSGSYETTAAWAKSMRKKDFRGLKSPVIPGGKFVQVKKKCKNFPYCNQGDINALKIWENENLKKVINKVSENHNISKNVIKNIIAYELGLI